MTTPSTGLQFRDEEPKRFFSILLYAAHGLGKTTAALSAPGPVVVANAEGKARLRYARRHHKGKQILDLPITGKGGRGALRQLFLEIRDGNPFGIVTVVLDSLGRMYAALLEDVARANGHVHVNEDGSEKIQASLPDHSEVQSFLVRYIEALIELDVHVVLVAHDIPIEVASDGGEHTVIELYPFCGVQKPTVAKELLRMVDIVGYCGRKEGAKPDDPPQFVAQTYTAGGRLGKDGTDVLGKAPPLDLTDWVERIRAAYDGGDAADKKKREPAKAAT